MQFYHHKVVLGFRVGKLMARLLGETSSFTVPVRTPVTADVRLGIVICLVYRLKICWT
jgi:hypothetical protein